jgi:ubiquinone/menaquinone biosynthesis C-methylase UbiE
MNATRMENDQMNNPITTSLQGRAPLAAAAPPPDGARPMTPTHFSGSIPDDYDRYLGPLLFDFSGRDMARRVEAGLGGQASARVVEVACGTGISTEHLWRQLPSGTRIVATDLSPAMLDYAILRRGSLPGVSFEPAPADALPFDDAQFDALVCHFGIMFFEDKLAALDEFARVLRPGGLLAFSVWESHDKNPVVGLSHRTIASFFRSDPPGFLKLPFSYHDTEAISALVKRAGFEAVEACRVRETVRSHDALGIARGFVMGNPGVLEILERGSTDPGAIIRTLADRIETEFASEEGALGCPDGGAPELYLALEEITFTARRR